MNQEIYQMKWKKNTSNTSDASVSIELVKEISTNMFKNKNKIS